MIWFFMYNNWIICNNNISFYTFSWYPIRRSLANKNLNLWHFKKTFESELLTIKLQSNQNSTLTRFPWSSLFQAVRRTTFAVWRFVFRRFANTGSFRQLGITSGSGCNPGRLWRSTYQQFSVRSTENLTNAIFPIAA